MSYRTPCGPPPRTPSYPGLSVLRDLARHRGTPVLAPVVFTSALGLGELFGSDVTEAFGTPSWIISQGPQVSLDAQVTEFDGGVMVNWDVRDDVFPAGVIDAMFAHHVDELRRLASDERRVDAAGPSGATGAAACGARRGQQPTCRAQRRSAARRLLSVVPPAGLTRLPSCRVPVT